MNINVLTEAQAASFQHDGFVVVPGLLDASAIAQMRAVADDHVAAQLAPVEYEVDVQYPGSPRDAKADGGETTRRLLHAYSRHEVYRNWATDSHIKQILESLFASPNIELSQCHHNCMMTKHPGFSSATLWHQDNRYWSFDEENLISVWTALGDESP
ncbi:MAG: phytanoyl-CoA hydroxylase, partial [Litorivivens sp.]